MTDPSLRPAVVLANLGTPDEPTTGAVRRFLRQFLSDRRVIETHPALWQPILEGIILRVRPRRSAGKYRMVWTDQGSPIMRYTRAQRDHLAADLGSAAEVRYAMRYGTPDIRSVLDDLHAAGHRRVLVMPLYPQYSATTIASVTDEVYRWNLAARDQFDLRVSRSFQTNPAYIEALAAAVEDSWSVRGRPDFAAGDRLVLSYHGIPQAMHAAGDPYALECEETTAALLARLGLQPGDALHTYQSVFGPAEWLKPATIDTVAQLGEDGTRRVDVICPGFVSDCLETLEEIDMENRRAFISAGGREFHYLPWGNDLGPWLATLGSLARANLAGWV